MTERIQMVPRTVYIANDGTEYDDQYDCMAHESDLLAKAAEEKIRKIPSFDYAPEFSDSEKTWTWYRVSGQADLENVLAWNGIERGLFGFDPTSITKFPCWVAVSVNDFDHEASIEGTVDEVLERLHEYENNLMEAIKQKEEEI